MIGGIHDNHMQAAGIGARQPQGQVIGLTAGINKKADIQRGGQEAGQTGCIIRQLVIDIS